MNLRLSNLGLQGQFPKGLQSCSSLTQLDLSGNNFSGPVPSDIARQVPYLAYLNLSNNSFSGEIPVDISAITYLNVLNIQHNQLSGQIPGQLGVLARLTVFNVSDNLLSGPIPWSLQKFPASNFAGNQGLCGLPLDDCHGKRNWGMTTVLLHRINIESSIGAVVGFVAGFVVAVYCTVSPYLLHLSDFRA
ncbi:hypothetical protein QOZ80_1AG0042740 [Eleusine coracana subsp. coracana]|nr:hypothetical protein QOZ80_1AG0042740 [Eleusine coracana subsp. coracana]